MVADASMTRFMNGTKSATGVKMSGFTSEAQRTDYERRTGRVCSFLMPYSEPWAGLTYMVTTLRVVCHGAAQRDYWLPWL